MEFFLCVIGMVLVVEGLPYFGFPEKMKELMRFVQQQDDSTLRAMGAILLMVGLLLLLLARRGIGAP
jgi:uncharacterized protein